MTTKYTRLTLAVDGVNTAIYTKGIRCFVLYAAGTRVLIPVAGHPKKLGYAFAKASVAEAAAGRACARAMIEARTLPKELKGFVDLRTRFK
jgi:hypothetical protein